MQNLQASPCVRFNREGILLAVSTNDHGVKILANDDGIRLLRTVENRPFAPAAVMKVFFVFFFLLVSLWALYVDC